jgi:hypothetical protein
MSSTIPEDRKKYNIETRTGPGKQHTTEDRQTVPGATAQGGSIRLDKLHVGSFRTGNPKITPTNSIRSPATRQPQPTEPNLTIGTQLRPTEKQATEQKPAPTEATTTKIKNHKKGKLIPNKGQNPHTCTQ